MKVVDIKTMVVENEPPYRGGRYLLFLQLITDEGIIGLGERITGNTYSAIRPALRGFAPKGAATAKDATGTARGWAALLRL